MNDRGVLIRADNADIARRSVLNLISTAYLTWDVQEDAPNREVEITPVIEPNDLVEAAYPAARRIQWVTAAELIEFMQQSSGGGTQAQTANEIRYHPHVETTSESTYDALTFGTGTSPGAGATGKVALYSAHATTGRPDALLWTGNDQDIAASGVFHSVFASGGTWQAAGASFKDGSDRLVLTRGQMIWKAWVRNASGSPTSRTITSPRALAVDSSGAWTPLNGFSETCAYASAFPSTGGGVGGLADHNGTVIFLPLRRVA